MFNRFLSTVRKFNMVSEGDTILLGVSGGADSMVMLDMFIKLRDVIPVNLKVAHIEHGIRGAESLADAEFVKQFCAERNIEFSMLTISAVNDASACGMTIEEYSRIKRYEFFNSIECDKIATAHNADDNAETLLFRMARGTGLKGACSIPAVRGKIIRPLIECSGAQIRAYADKVHIPYRVDSTNSHNDYTRNYIRNEIMPLFDKVNSSASEQINNFISDINEDNSFIEHYAEIAYAKCEQDAKLVKNNMRSYDLAIIKRIVKKYFSSYGISVDRKHLSEIIELLNKMGKIQIKDDIYAVSDKFFLYMSKLKSKKEFIEPFYEVAEKSNIDFTDVDFYCDYDKINGNVYFRVRQSGDTISPAGRNCTKSLKKLYNELCIPVMDRENVPVICDDSGILGVIGYCVDERVRVDSNTTRILYCKIPMED